MLSREAKELCLECWALAAKALFHRALMSREARYRVWDSDRNREGKPRCETDNTQDLSRIIDRNATSCCEKDPWFLLPFLYLRTISSSSKSETSLVAEELLPYC